MPSNTSVRWSRARRCAAPAVAMPPSMDWRSCLKAARLVTMISSTPSFKGDQADRNNMPRKKLGLLHTSATLVPIFEQLCKSHLPGVSTFNLVDDSLIKDCIAHGSLRPQTARRVTQLVAAAE